MSSTPQIESPKTESALDTGLVERCAVETSSTAASSSPEQAEQQEEERWVSPHQTRKDELIEELKALETERNAKNAEIESDVRPPFEVSKKDRDAAQKELSKFLSAKRERRNELQKLVDEALTVQKQKREELSDARKAKKGDLIKGLEAELKKSEDAVNAARKGMREDAEMKRLEKETARTPTSPSNKDEAEETIQQKKDRLDKVSTEKFQALQAARKELDAIRDEISKKVQEKRDVQEKMNAEWKEWRGEQWAESGTTKSQWRKRAKEMKARGVGQVEEESEENRKWRMNYLPVKAQGKKEVEAASK